MNDPADGRRFLGGKASWVTAMDLVWKKEWDFNNKRKQVQVSVFFFFCVCFFVFQKEIKWGEKGLEKKGWRVKQFYLVVFCFWCKLRLLVFDWFYLVVFFLWRWIGIWHGMAVYFVKPQIVFCIWKTKTAMSNAGGFRWFFIWGF